MRMKSDYKFKMLTKIGLLVCLTAALFCFEPVIRDISSFAVPHFDNSATSQEGVKTGRPVDQQTMIKKRPVPEKSHAPEASSLVLILGGLSGIIVRFARRKFEQFKRASDIILSIVGLLIASPILALAAIGIRLTSRGPIIYTQNRVGKKGEIFRIYKLRTMRQDAEQETGVVWAQENDPRITLFGRFLRKAHIDEIPQLINVLRGQMSIVGPRPERPELVRDLKTLILDYEKRLMVKPGITGLAQVWHKYDETIEDVKKKIKYDILYIKKMCLLVDLRILAQTCIVVLTGKGAR